MKLFKVMKDGGEESRVWGLWFVEIKKLFSVAFLLFKDGSREAHHSHAFNSISWVLKGRLEENMLNGDVNVYTRSWRPIVTRRKDFHKVISKGDTYVFTMRGPWTNIWNEFIPGRGFVLLTHGRKVVCESTDSV